jgi:hypothetical protein
MVYYETCRMSHPLGEESFQACTWGYVTEVDPTDGMAGVRWGDWSNPTWSQ